MRDLLNQITPVLTTTFIAVLVAIIGYLGKEIIKLVPIVIESIVAKIGLTNYQKTRLIALDIWNVVEEHFRLNQIIGDKVQAKITMFESLIKQKIPGITDENTETVRQAIAGEVNKNKATVIKAIEQPIQEVPITPIIKYITPDGTELQPVAAIEITNAATGTSTNQVIQ